MKVFITRRIMDCGLQYLRDAEVEISEWTTKRDLTSEELIEFSNRADAITERRR